MKPCYLGNYASEIKSYWGTLSRSIGRSFKISHKNSPGAPPCREIMMTSVIKHRVKCPLAAKSRWRHIRLSIKLRCLGNYASQINSYYKILWGSNSCSFRISHEKSPDAPPSEEITMTSYPVCNETSLSRKPCIPDEKLLWNAMRKSRSLVQNPSWKISWSDPSSEITMTSYTACNKTLLSRKPWIPDIKLIWNTNSKSWSLS